MGRAVLRVDECSLQVDIPIAPWANASAAAPVDFDFAPRKFHMTCCNKDQDSDNVDFTQCTPETMIYERDAQIARL